MTVGRVNQLMTINAREELIDLLDDAGNTIGVIRRGDMRGRRLPHRVAYVLVFNRLGELFVHLRTPTKDVFPSYWDVCVGGVLAAGESYLVGARREIEEELGIALEPDELFPFRFEDDRTVVFGMVYRAVHDGPFRLQPEEIRRGEFAVKAALAERIKCDRFCPDGLAVLAEFQRRQTDC